MTRYSKLIYHTVRYYCSWLGLEILALGKRNLKSRGGRNMLLFAWNLPPRWSSGTFRPLSFARYGPTLGWRIDALSGPVPRQSIIEASDGDAEGPSYGTQSLNERGRPSSRFFPTMDGAFHRAIDGAMQARSSNFAREYDIVIATGPPFQLFACAWFVARAKRAALVLDYRDEWTENPFIQVRSTFETWWERRCLRGARLVIFTTESQRKHQLARFAELDPSRTMVLPNGWDPVTPLSSRQRPSARPHPTNLAISYVGLLGYHVPLIDFLKVVEGCTEPLRRSNLRLTIRFVGTIEQASARILERQRHTLDPAVITIETIGPVCAKAALKALQEADFLLLMCDERLTRYLPGKLYDYLASGRPILVFGEDGEVSATVESLSAGVRIRPGESHRLVALLRGELSIPKYVELRVYQEWLASHSRQRLAARLFARLGDTVGLQS